MTRSGPRRRLPEIVTVREVGARDGLQSEPPLSVDDRVRLLDALSGCGFPKIEAVAFVSPKAVPAMADAGEVWRRARKAAVVHYSALVPNRRGAEAAVEAGGFSALQAFISASDGYNTRNVGKTVAESMRDVSDVVRVAGQARLPVEVSVSCCFGDPYEGEVAPERVVEVLAGLTDLGISGASLADTTGMATPTRVWALVELVWERFPDLALNLHFHDSRGLAMANVLAALQAGVTEFDASVGGIGGSPFAPGAGGNVATEDLVHMLDDMAVRTGVHLDRVIGTARLLESLLGHPLPGHVHRAGPRSAPTGGEG